MTHICNCPECNESEEENAYWGDVYYTMQERGCTKEEAMKILADGAEIDPEENETEA